MVISEIVSGPGFDTLNVWAGELTTRTFSNVPEIFILDNVFSEWGKIENRMNTLHHWARLRDSAVGALAVLQSGHSYARSIERLRAPRTQ